MSGRLEALRSLLAEEGVPALLVSNPANVAYLSGFTGTSGYVLVSEGKACLLTDFRYLEQAAEQAKGFEVVNVGQSAWEQMKKLLVSDKLAFEA